MAYIMVVWINPITVVETLTFQRQADDVWSDDEREAFVDFIARNPEAGDVIRDGGGVRKVRWGRGGTGKRGGTRVIYFFYNLDTPLYLLLVYAKAVRTDISPAAKKAVREFADLIKQAHRRPTERRNK
jgi:hypothetical protein